MVYGFFSFGYFVFNDKINDSAPIWCYFFSDASIAGAAFS